MERADWRLLALTAALGGALALVPGCDTSVAAGSDAGPADAGADAGADGGSPDAHALSPSCVEAVNHSDLAWLQDNIFTPSCANFAQCHMGDARSAAGLNLEDGNTEANLVNRVATSNGIDGLGLIVVTPGDSTTSYLMVLIDHVSKGGRLDGPLPTAGTMPFNTPLMCVEKRDAIARWIDSL